MTANRDQPGPGGTTGDIRETVRELTAQALRGGQVDTQRVEEVVRRMSAAAGAEPAPVAPPTPEARAALLRDLEALDLSLVASAEAAHQALARLIERGPDFSDNDLKEAFARLEALQRSYVETVDRVADVASGDLKRELQALAGHAQQAGVDAGARVAGLMTEFANRLNAGTRSTVGGGLDAARDYGTSLSMLASGMLAGVADGLRDQVGDAGRKDEPAG